MARLSTDAYTELVDKIHSTCKAAESARRTVEGIVAILRGLERERNRAVATQATLGPQNALVQDVAKSVLNIHISYDKLIRLNQQSIVTANN